MAALVADRNPRIETGGATRVGEGDVAAATTIYKGSLLAKNAAGFLVPASDAAALKVIGIAEEKVVNAGAAGAAVCKYITGITAELVNLAGAIVQASKHGLCYVGDDQSVTTALVALNDVPVGTVTSFTAAKVMVFIDERANA